MNPRAEYHREYMRRYKAQPEKRARLNEQARALYAVARSDPKKSERITAQHREWCRTNKERVNAQARDARKTAQGWAKTSVWSARRRARAAGIPFNLVASAITVPARCPITLREFVYDNGDDHPSLDRVIPELGYVLGNVRVISKGANRAKNNVTDPEIFRRIAAYLEGGL